MSLSRVDGRIVLGDGTVVSQKAEWTLNVAPRPVVDATAFGESRTYEVQFTWFEMAVRIARVFAISPRDLGLVKSLRPQRARYPSDGNHHRRRR